MAEIHDNLAPVCVQRKVGEGDDDVPIFLTAAIHDPTHQCGQVFGARGEGLTGHVHLESLPLSRAVGEPRRKCAGYALRDLRRRIWIRQESDDRNALG
ncbi:hypothetical protein [Streptomyces zhihengii]|uniref:Uncharacterized protein n=1 Tax=Streptomyces zhihengii TaxID=1818004 RepID=A0ABS2V365_9ACTN|nr:hypothetical protein [Streptomyces zhihengii]MBM9624175.1 hypothetical protein [Streptomyces zhihengii]